MRQRHTRKTKATVAERFFASQSWSLRFEVTKSDAPSDAAEWFEFWSRTCIVKPMENAVIVLELSYLLYPCPAVSLNNRHLDVSALSQGQRLPSNRFSIRPPSSRRWFRVLSCAVSQRDSADGKVRYEQLWECSLATLVRMRPLVQSPSSSSPSSRIAFALTAPTLNTR